MNTYIVRIRLADGPTTEPGLIENAWSPSEAATQRIKRLLNGAQYDTGTVIVTVLNERAGCRDPFYVYDWTREIVTSKEVKLS